MIDENRRIEIYNTAFSFMIENSLSSIPVYPKDLCNNQGIELITLTQIVTESGLNEDDIFAIWGNKDGVLQQYNGNYKIAYNDTMPLTRQRFTLLEELSHKLLKHIEEPGFNMFSQQYDTNTYDVFEEEARMCAGLILCPPQFYYNLSFKMTRCSFQRIFNVSESCANARMDILQKYEGEIKKSKLYKELPKIQYRHNSEAALFRIRYSNTERVNLF